MNYLILLLAGVFAPSSVCSQKPLDSTIVYIIHRAIPVGEITIKGMYTHFDKYPMRVTFPDGNSVWLAGSHNFSSLKINYIKIVSRKEIPLQIKTVMFPRSISRYGKNAPTIDKFPSADTSIVIGMSGNVQYYLTKRTRNKGKIMTALIPIDKKNKRNKKYFKEIDKDKPVAIYNETTNKFILNFKWDY